MSKPVIGITTAGRDENNYFRLSGEYVDAVRRAGGVPVLLAAGQEHSDDLLAPLDGVILSGGGDLSPQLYQGEMHATLYNLDNERDEFELSLARRLLETQCPTLAICRGMQLINVVLGGTLHVHLPDVVGDEVLHRLLPREPTRHIINIHAESRLAELLNHHVQFDITSWHHQGVNVLAEVLTAVAWSSDGVIEAVESDQFPQLIAVQWHPEMTAAGDPIQQRLFDSLVSFVKDKE